MPAIIKNFRIQLTERQAGQIRRQFQLACKEAGLDRAAMLAQPKTTWCGCGSIGLKPPVLDCVVITMEVFTALNAVMESHRNPEALQAMREKAKQSKACNDGEKE